MSDDYLDGIHDNTKLIRESVEWLERLSQSFYMIGNDFLAKELARCAADLYTAQDNIQSAVALELSRQCNKVREEAGRF